MSVPSRPILGIRQGRFSGPFPALHDAIKLFLVTKAAQDVPPGIRQAIVRVHVPEAADRPIVQIAEPEPATTRKEHPQMRHTALKIYPQAGLMRGGPLSASRIHPLCGYAATEGGKAAQEVPPGIRQAVFAFTHRRPQSAPLSRLPNQSHSRSAVDRLPVCTPSA